MFGFERKIMIRIADIKYASLHRTTSIKVQSQCDNGKEEERKTVEEYIFRSFRDRSSVLQTILGAYERHVGQELSNEECSPEDYMLRNNAEEHPVTTPSRNILKKREAQEIGNFDGNRGLNGLQDLLRGRLNSSGDVSDIDNDVYSSPPRSRRSTLDESLHPIENTMESANIPVNIMKDAQKEWNTIKDMSVAKYTEIAVDRQTLSISLNEFFGTFLADDAPHSMKKFQETIIKDENVQCTKWSPKYDSLEDGAECIREITADHKRKARVGPASVPLERTQTIRKHGNYGIVINTILKLDGIPYGDSFEMRDEWIIEAKGDKEITIRVGFKIHFIKTTMVMVRKVIMNQSRNEVSTWFNSYINMVKTVMGDDRHITKKVDTEDHNTNWRSFLPSRLGTSLNCFIIVLSVLAYYILTLRQRGALLESQASQIQVINESFATLQSELRQRDALLESQVSQIQVINQNFATLQYELRQIRNNNEIWKRRVALLESQVSQIQVINENFATLQSELRQMRNNNEIWTESLGSFLNQEFDCRYFFNKDENFYLDGKPWRYERWMR
jgi:hypothetical protein